MPWSGAQATVTVPVAGCGKSKTNWPGNPKLNCVAGTSLTRKSDASTPVTGSLKNTSTLASERFVEPASGNVRITTGASISNTAVNDASTCKSLLAELTLKT